ncbi:acyltransferase family protein [Burkholderia multivorans]|uniref:acyltransferase family protein n=1 Tax=Burkholderia multivorans TaxID=87883 RepID=UPI001C22DA8E|nr:acyltransferase [Burkholderia multivorans]MBU9310852.1 acyltransferase [Burkholderia multivorans]
MRENLKSLTTLRFFAAAAIAVHHTSWYFGYGKHLSELFPLDLGVSFFFVLSGFVLYYSHPALPSVRDKARFVVARIARIWPAHVATLLLIIVFLPYPWAAGPNDATQAPPILANLLLLQSWIPLPHYFFSFNGVSWSISTEMFFYAMFPLLIWNWDRTKWAKIFCAALLAGACIAWATASHAPFLSTTNSESIDGFVYIFPPARLFEFAVGILTAWAWIKYRNRFLRLATPMQVVSVLLVAFGVPLVIKATSAAASHGMISMAITKWLFESGSAPIFAIAIFSMAMTNGAVARLLSAKPLVLLGEISFSLYLTHQLLMRALDGTHSLSAFGSMSHQFFMYWVFALGLSFSLWTFIEKPCRRTIVAKFDALWPATRTSTTEHRIARG